MARQLQPNGQWVEVPDSSTPSKKVESPKESSSGSSSSGKNQSSQNNKGDTTSAEENARKYSDSEYVLEGDAEVFPDPKLKSKQNVNISGIGDYLSGSYYVTKVTHTWGSSGYTQTMTVSKNGFKGQSLKKPVDTRRDKVKSNKE